MNGYPRYTLPLGWATEEEKEVEAEEEVNIYTSGNAPAASSGRGVAYIVGKVKVLGASFPPAPQAPLEAGLQGFELERGCKINDEPFSC